MSVVSLQPLSEVTAEMTFGPGTFLITVHSLSYCATPAIQEFFIHFSFHAIIVYWLPSNGTRET